MDNFVCKNCNLSNNSNREIIKDKNLSIKKKNNEEKICNECSICYENIVENKKILKCGHIFHKNCIDSWTKINPICPYCRSFLAEDFSCKRIRKIFSLNCKIIINEETFKKIIINTYFPFTNIIYKSYIIPTKFIKRVESEKNICILLFKKSVKEPIIKYRYKFKTNELSEQFSNMMKKLFDKYLFYYENEIFENQVFEN